MAEEDYDLVPYKDISELKKELEGLKGSKSISTKELYDTIQKLSQTINDMLEVFGAAAEQLKLEEREHETESKKHDSIGSKLDKLIEQNKTIAEGMIAIVEMIKEKLVAPPRERDEPYVKPAPEPKFTRPSKTEWQPTPEPMMPTPEPFMPKTQPSMAPPMPPPMAVPDFGMGMPPMEPEPSPSLDLPDETEFAMEGPKKKGLFGMFKK